MPQETIMEAPLWRATEKFTGRSCKTKNTSAVSRKWKISDTDLAEQGRALEMRIEKWQGQFIYLWCVYAYKLSFTDPDLQPFIFTCHFFILLQKPCLSFLNCWTCQWYKEKILLLGKLRKNETSKLLHNSHWANVTHSDCVSPLVKTEHMMLLVLELRWGHAQI